MPDNDTSQIDPLAAFDQGETPDTPEQMGDMSVSEEVETSDVSETDASQMQVETPEAEAGEESIFKSTDTKSFSTLGDEQADISEYQESHASDPDVAQVHKEVSIEDRLVRIHAMSKFALAIVILVCLVFIADAFAKSNPDGSPLLRLPFFVQDNILCDRINGGPDLSGLLKDSAFLASTGNQDFKTAYDAGKCFSRNELTKIYEERREYLDKETGKVLSEVLPKKFSFVSFSESPLFRFIQSQSPERRASHANLVTDILAVVEKVDTTGDMSLLCQRITFEDKVATVNCLARGQGSTTSRDVVLRFLDDLKREPDLLIIDHPDSIELRQVDDETGYDTESSVDLHIIYRPSGHETSVIPKVD